jgi:hypothetical protein
MGSRIRRWAAQQCFDLCIEDGSLLDLLLDEGQWECGSCSDLNPPNATRTGTCEEKFKGCTTGLTAGDSTGTKVHTWINQECREHCQTEVGLPLMLNHGWECGPCKDDEGNNLVIPSELTCGAEYLCGSGLTVCDEGRRIRSYVLGECREMCQPTLGLTSLLKNGWECGSCEGVAEPADATCPGDPDCETSVFGRDGWTIKRGNGWACIEHCQPKPGLEFALKNLGFQCGKC